MKLPRWTTYPAIAVLLASAFVALPHVKQESSQGAAARVRSEGGVASETIGSLTAGEGASRRDGEGLAPRVQHLPQPPSQGAWRKGDIVYNSQPSSGGRTGWVCSESGSPGVWTGFGRIE